jgi:hypothetical protein
LTFSIRLSTFLSNPIGLKSQPVTQPQPFGESNEKELPKVPSLKPPRELVIPLEAFKMAGTCKANCGTLSKSIEWKEDENEKN